MVSSAVDSTIELACRCRPQDQSSPVSGLRVRQRHGGPLVPRSRTLERPTLGVGSPSDLFDPYVMQMCHILTQRGTSRYSGLRVDPGSRIQRAGPVRTMKYGTSCIPLALPRGSRHPTPTWRAARVLRYGRTEGTTTTRVKAYQLSFQFDSDCRQAFQ